MVTLKLGLDPCDRNQNGTVLILKKQINTVGVKKIKKEVWKGRVLKNNSYISLIREPNKFLFSLKDNLFKSLLIIFGSSIIYPKTRRILQIIQVILPVTNDILVMIGSWQLGQTMEIGVSLKTGPGSDCTCITVDRLKTETIDQLCIINISSSPA